MGEVKFGLDRLKLVEQTVGEEIFAAMSLHGIVSDVASENTALGSTGKEMGFLQLYAFTDVPPAGVDRRLAQVSIGLAVEPTPMTIAGQAVLRFEDPTSPSSRYTYSWLRGYLYADYEDSRVVKLFVRSAIGRVPYSVHRIADGEGQLGGLVLAEAPPDLTTDAYADAVGLAADASVPLTVGSTPVRRYTTDDGDVYVWAQGGIAGALLAGRTDAAPAFLEALLTAPR